MFLTLVTALGAANVFVHKTHGRHGSPPRRRKNCFSPPFGCAVVVVVCGGGGVRWWWCHVREPNTALRSQKMHLECFNGPHCKKGVFIQIRFVLVPLVFRCPAQTYRLALKKAVRDKKLGRFSRVVIFELVSKRIGEGGTESWAGHPEPHGAMLLGQGGRDR